MTDWLAHIHPQTISLLEQLSLGNGAYRYSLSGDLFPSRRKANIAGSIFALKLYALLGETNPPKIQPIIDRILTFQKMDGTFRDPFVARKRFVRHLVSSLTHGDFHNLGSRGYIRAETRQAYSSLLLFDVIPKHIITDVPTVPADIRRFLSRLDWSHPWGAGSHFSHLMFFLTLLRRAKHLDEISFQKAREAATTFISSLQQEDGAWYTGNPSHRQKVNGAMKVISGLMVDPLPFDHPDRLIDLCLSQHADNTDDACDQINQIHVLRYSVRMLTHTYREDDIKAFCLNTLEQWRAYYHPTSGGFSFYKNRAAIRYYGARVNRGLNEPDIHGTVLFLWGLSLLKHLVPIRALESLTEILT